VNFDPGAHVLYAFGFVLKSGCDIVPDAKISGINVILSMTQMLNSLVVHLMHNTDES
jgi:hypothetical protein